MGALLAKARKAVLRAGLSNRVEVVERDIMSLHGDPRFEEATVVYAYLLPDVIKRLEALLRDAVEAGKRVLIYCTTGHWDRASAGNLIGSMEPMAEAMMGMLRMYCTMDTAVKFGLGNRKASPEISPILGEDEELR